MDSRIGKLKRKKEISYENENFDSVYKYLIEIAELHVQSENYDDALTEYKEAVHAGEICKNQMHIARANRMIAEVCVMMQKPKDAIQFVRKYLEISRKERDLKEEQRALATLARIYFIIAEDLLPSKEREDALLHAQKYNIKSLEICDRLEGESGTSAKNIGEMRARVYLNLGLVEEAIGNLQKSVHYLGKSVVICKTLDLWEELCMSYTNLGLTHKHNGDFANALKAFDLGLTVAHRLSEKEKYMTDLYVHRAMVLLELPDFRRAKHSLNKAYKLKSASKDRAEIVRKLKIVAAINEFEEKLIHLSENDISERRKIYESMGDGFAALESYRNALEYYKLTLECSEKLGESGKKASDILVSLAQTYKDLKDYDNAIEHYNRELAIWKDNPAEACNTTLSIVDVLELKHASDREIVTTYRGALCLAREAKNQKLERTVLRDMLAYLSDKKNSVMTSEIEKQLEEVEKRLHDQSESSSESEDSPPFGDHICLDMLSDSEADEENSESKPRTARRTRGGFQLRRNEKGETPLHVACINGNLNLVSKLLDQGHPVDVRDYNGWTPLHEAANHGFVEIVRELIDRGAAINDSGGPHCDGVTPLLDAASCGHFLVMDLLLDKGASPTVRTNKGDTVLDCLIGWRQRYTEEENADLTGQTLRDYNTIVEKIKLAFEKAGHKVANEKTSERLQRRGSFSRTDHSEVRQPNVSRQSRYLPLMLTSTNKRRKSKEDPVRRSLSVSPHRPEYQSSSADTSAVSEYQNAIRGMKHRTTVNTEVPVSPIKVSQGALLDAENVVDDWLIDDMNDPESSRPSKRRKRGDHFSDNLLRRSSTKEKFKNYKSSNPVCSMVEYSDSEICVSNEINYGPDDDDDDDSSSKDERYSQLSSKSSDVVNLGEDNSSNKRQTTLLDAGISKVSVQTAEVAETDRLPDGMQTCIKENVEPPSALPPIFTTSERKRTIKVRVEGKLLLVVLPNDPSLTISWLAEETACRYQRMECAKPKLTLQTVEGAVLYSEDLLTEILDQGSEVNAVVTAWEYATIKERYRLACRTCKTARLSEVEAIMDGLQSTVCLDVGNLSLFSNELLPVFKAVAHEHSLRALRLGGNNLGDSGLQDLVNTLGHLPQLKELDLNCCNISRNGLSHMCSLISQKNLFQGLEIIDLSFNFIGDECLLQLCSKFPSLHTLKLAFLDLESITILQDLHLDEIEVLDLSGNKIGREAVREILTKLNPDKISSLGFSHAGQSVAHEVATFFKQHVPHNLANLDLSYCDLTDDEMEQLFECLKMCHKLRNLQLEGNSRLSQSTVQKLCQLQLSRLNLGGVYCDLQNIEHSIENLCVSVRPGFKIDPLSSNDLLGPYGFFTNNRSSLF